MDVRYHDRVGCPEAPEATKSRPVRCANRDGRMVLKEACAWMAEMTIFALIARLDQIARTVVTCCITRSWLMLV